MTIKIASPWRLPSITIPPWDAHLGGPIWMLNNPGDGTEGAQGGQGAATGGTAGQGAGTTDSTGTTGSTGEGAQSGAATTDDKVSRTEFETLRNQLSAADKARQAAEDKLKGIEDAKKGDLEKATERADQAEQKATQLEQEVQQLRLEKAMLTDAEFGADKWHDPDDVLVRLNRAVKDQQVVLKDGVPDPAQVKAFLKELSTKKAYLLKSTAGTGDGATGKSGEAVGAGDRRTTADSDARKAQLRSKYRIP